MFYSKQLLVSIRAVLKHRRVDLTDNCVYQYQENLLSDFKNIFFDLTEI